MTTTTSKRAAQRQRRNAVAVAGRKTKGKTPRAMKGYSDAAMQAWHRIGRRLDWRLTPGEWFRAGFDAAYRLTKRGRGGAAGGRGEGEG